MANQQRLNQSFIIFNSTHAKKSQLIFPINNKTLIQSSCKYKDLKSLNFQDYSSPAPVQPIHLNINKPKA